VSIQGGSNLSEEEIQALLEEAERKAVEDRRKRAVIDRRNRALTLVSQAERRLRDAALELGPYGAERQQRSVELAVRQVQDLLADQNAEDPELELAVSQLQEALFGLNRRLLSEQRSEGGPLQGLKNTLGSLKDELFADDDWDTWEPPSRSDRWDRSDPWNERAPRLDRFREDTPTFRREETAPYGREERAPYGGDEGDPYREEKRPFRDPPRPPRRPTDPPLTSTDFDRDRGRRWDRDNDDPWGPL
jgi:molecular chaperone DnaK